MNNIQSEVTQSSVVIRIHDLLGALLVGSQFRDFTAMPKHPAAAANETTIIVKLMNNANDTISPLASNLSEKLGPLYPDRIMHPRARTLRVTSRPQN